MKNAPSGAFFVAGCRAPALTHKAVFTIKKACSPYVTGANSY